MDVGFCVYLCGYMFVCLNVRWKPLLMANDAAQRREEGEGEARAQCELGAI